MRAIKTSLEAITNNSQEMAIIDEVVSRTNTLVMYTSFFIKAYIIYYYQKHHTIPTIDENFVKCCFGVIGSNSIKRGRKITKNAQLMKELNDFYDKTCSSSFCGKIDTKNLSHIILYQVNDIIKNIKNNIVLHFPKYIKKYCLVNIIKNNTVSIKKSEMPKIDMKTINRNINRMMFNKKFIFKDSEATKCIDNLKDDTFDYDPNFLSSIKNLRLYHNLPEKVSSINYMEDIKEDPFKFLPCMIGIMKEIEQYNIYLEMEGLKEQKIKLYQVIPIRTSTIPKYMPIDKSIILDILYTENKASLYKKQNNNQMDNIWKTAFSKLYTKKNKRLLKQGNYEFDHLIYTDGYGVSLIQKKIKGSIYKDKYKKRQEFPNIDELNEEERKKLESMHLVGVDPGKRNIIHLIDENNNKLRYSSQQRQVECYHKRAKKRRNHLRTEEVTTAESELSKTCSKSTNLNIFLKYVREKKKANDKILQKFYEKKEFRENRWRTYINTQKSHAKLINTINEKYKSSDNQEICLMYGNWSQTKQMANYYPTPGIGFKRMLSKSFKIITVDEFKTSKLCCSCENETENPISRKNPKPYKDDIKTVHSLLRCKNVNCNKYYDRDVNGSKNILKLALHHIKFGERKNTFVRQNEDEEKKPLNP